MIDNKENKQPTGSAGTTGNQSGTGSKQGQTTPTRPGGKEDENLKKGTMASGQAGNLKEGREEGRETKEGRDSLQDSKNPRSTQTREGGVKGSAEQDELTGEAGEENLPENSARESRDADKKQGGKEQR